MGNPIVVQGSNCRYPGLYGVHTRYTGGGETFKVGETDNISAQKGRYIAEVAATMTDCEMIAFDLMLPNTPKRVRQYAEVRTINEFADNREDRIGRFITIPNRILNRDRHCVIIINSREKRRINHIIFRELHLTLAQKAN